MGSPEPRSRLASENKVCTKLEPEPHFMTATGQAPLTIDTMLIADPRSS